MDKFFKVFYKAIGVSFLLTLGYQGAFSQDLAEAELFPLNQVTLLEGPFKNARDLNVRVLLEYNTDRLLAPYLKEANLEPKETSFENWIGLDGHVGGHYLSALAIHYAVTGNQECKERMDYMVSELQRCQHRHEEMHPEWGVGYVGGVPGSRDVWSRIKAGEVAAVWDYWVPWYNVHKTYAGLRDAWLYGENRTAKELFLEMCDWGISLTAGLTDEQMESMLASEHGGMNEVFADAYEMTGEQKYLDAARRFSHKFLLDPMASGKDNLDNLHANTQVPKAVGFQRVAEESKDPAYFEASRFFWDRVTGHRSIAIGGNSRREFFPPASGTEDFINVIEGPESCNTYNMLRLTQGLFRMDQDARYVDYYERALYNHILSTQHPEHGGYVYFTPARPRHYRVYSAPNQAMWCCVGTGMENHGNYGEFIYAHSDNALYVNLFIASELTWTEKNVTVRQETNFPDTESTRIIIAEGSGNFDLKIRYPGWVQQGELRIEINGEQFKFNHEPSSYVTISRNWSEGDSIEIMLPMHTVIEPLLNRSDYVAFVHGPIVLGSKTGTEHLSGLVAGNGRWEHIAHGKLLPVTGAPIIVENDQSVVAEKIEPVAHKPLTFKTADISMVNTSGEMLLEPFFRIHDARYMMYWMLVSESSYQNIRDSLELLEAEKLALDARTIDAVIPGQQQPEADHAMKSSNSHKGVHLDRFWRDARDGGYFSYELTTGEEDIECALMVGYWGNETGKRTFDILIDDQKLVTESISSKWNSDEFINVEYKIPKSLLKGKPQIVVKFQAPEKGIAGGVYDVRLVKRETK